MTSQGSKTADFGHLITVNIPRLRRYARALVHDIHLADDLVQDCLERAWTKQHLWRDRGNIRAWLFTILHNVYANAARRYQRMPKTVSWDANTQQGTGPSQETMLALRDLQRCLAQLPDSQREVILLVGMEQLSYEETAKVLDIPVGTVMSRLSRARAKLRTAMKVVQDPVLRRVK